MQRLNWDNLLCEKRLRESKSKKNEGWNIRNAFEADYDRIVGSSSVRRLQDKAQVFPLQKNDVVRTRLTHSIEVSAVAKSLGKSVGMRLEAVDNPEFDREKTEKLSALLQTAGLIHDLGNPPFGHYGENVIRDWCKNCKRLKHLSESQKRDFEYFDGNVQNLRIVTKLQTMNDVYGANFTLGTLATIMKYPTDSCELLGNKFGYYQSEKDIAERIWKETGLEKGIRHPATYLLEAADDIIYICDDIEDGVKKGYIQWDTVYEQEIKNNSEYGLDAKKYLDIFERIENNPPDSHMVKEEQIQAKVRVFRNTIQGFLIQRVVEEFMDNYEDIMNGKYTKKELLDCEKNLVKCLKKVSAKYCFSCHEVLALEITGDRVIRTLLDIFAKVLLEKNEEEVTDTRKYAGKVYSLISANYKYIALYNYDELSHPYRNYDKMTTYDRMHLIIDFISGMTDSYAVNLYKEFTGICLPE